MILTVMTTMVVTMRFRKKPTGNLGVSPAKLETRDCLDPAQWLTMRTYTNVPAYSKQIAGNTVAIGDQFSQLRC